MERTIEQFAQLKKYDLHSHLGTTRSGEKNSARQMVEELSSYNVQKVGIVSLSGNSYQEQNELVYQAKLEYPDFVEGYADIDPKDPGAFDEVNRTLGDFKFNGVKFMPWKHGYSCDNCPPLGAVLDEIGKYGRQVQVHVGQSPLCTPFVWIDHALRRPDMRFVFTHMGSRELGFTTLTAIKDVPNIWVETSAQEDFRILKKAFKDLGPRRIAYGGDWPYKPQNVEIEKLFFLGLSDSDLEFVLYKNAEYLWGE